MYGIQVPNPNSLGGLSHTLVGAHSPKIQYHPDFVCDILSQNPDGTTKVRLVKRLPHGQLSRIKKSTLAPDDWSDTEILVAVIQTGDTPAVATRSRDGATLHRHAVNGIVWEVIKGVTGNVTSAYPTGGTPTNHF